MAKLGDESDQPDFEETKEVDDTKFAKIMAYYEEKMNDNLRQPKHSKTQFFIGQSSPKEFSTFNL